ncbi:clusterin-like protein 1 [Menidia menidia]
MRTLFIPILCVATLALCASDSPPTSEDLLKKLSAAGEPYVEEEIKQTVLAVKQVKEMMDKREENHRHLMDALRHGSVKKRGATQLAKETEQKLKEVEQQCQDSIKASFRECRPCLEESCKSFYTSTCRRGFTSFSFKVEEFFRKMATQLEGTEHVYNPNQEDLDKPPSADNRVVEEEIDLELSQAESAFGQLLSEIGLLYDHTILLAGRVPRVFGRSFLASLTSDLQLSSPSAARDGSDAGFFKSLGLDHIVHSAYGFGKEVLEEFGSMVTGVFGETHGAQEHFQPSGRDAGSLSASDQPPSGYLCRQLRRQASECFQLQNLCETCQEDLIKECPSVQHVHSEMDEMQMLLNASSQQYEQRLQLVQRHTADTQRWLSNMQDKYDWVSLLSNSTGSPTSTFKVIAVNLQHQVRSNKPTGDRSVSVSILDSAPITLQVPPDLGVDDPAFIQYVAQEGLAHLKQLIRGKN